MKRVCGIFLFFFFLISISTVAHNGYYTKPIVRGKQHWDRHYHSASGQEMMGYAHRNYRTRQQDDGTYRHTYSTLSRVRCSESNIVDGFFYVQGTIFGVMRDKGWQFSGTISEHIGNHDSFTSTTKTPPLSSDCSVQAYISGRNPSLGQGYVANVRF